VPVAKSSKRRKQDQAKAAHKRAEQARRKARDELVQQLTLAMQRLLDPQTPPAEVADLVMLSVADDAYLAARVVQRRIDAGVEPHDIAEAGRHLLAAYTEEPPAGALAFAAVAAHADGQEEEEHRLTAQLLDAGRAGDVTAWLDVLDYVTVPWHPDETTELLEPYLVEHPEDFRGHRIYARAIRAVYQMVDESERASSAPLARFADRTALAVTREALDAYLERTAWGERVRLIAAGHFEDARGDDLPDEERAVFAALTVELALLSADDGDDRDDDLPAEDLLRQAEEEPRRQTLLEAFAAAPETPGELARRARDWNEGVVYGLWRMEAPTADPGVWVRDMVTGMPKYAEFPPGALEGAPPWTTWLGGLLPVDGIWRSTGVGLRLSPAEADAIGEYVDAAVQVLAVSLAGDSSLDVPAKPPIRFGQAEPYGVISEFDEPMAGEYAAFVSKVVAAVVPESAIEVLRYRAAPPRKRDMVFGSSAQLLTQADAAPVTVDQAKAWLDEAIPALQGLTPREAADSDDRMDLFRLESLLRQFEYEAGPAEAAGQAGMNVAWLRAELDVEAALDDAID
jgi:hypothetical protein